jgi:hypothetical protein
MIKLCLAILVLHFIPVNLQAQKTVPLPHGTTFGKRVDTAQNMPATRLEAFMGKMTRISTTVKGKVLKVDTPKGGWFRLDAGNGKVIKVHFKDYNVTIPTGLRGRQVMIEGVAQKQFIADDMQHFAGDTVTGKKQHQSNADPKQRLIFEATGLMVL